METLCRAKEIKCTNADHPDGYGHYREAPVTAIKHHWWWKVCVCVCVYMCVCARACVRGVSSSRQLILLTLLLQINHVFDGMKVTASYNGYVIFLEEDLYVAPDIFPVTKQLISMVDQ